MNDDLKEALHEQVGKMVEEDPAAIIIASRDAEAARSIVAGNPNAATEALGSLMFEIAEKAGVSIVDVSGEATKAAFDVRQSDDNYRAELDFSDDG